MFQFECVDVFDRFEFNLSKQPFLCFKDKRYIASALFVFWTWVVLGSVGCKSSKLGQEKVMDAELRPKYPFAEKKI